MRLLIVWLINAVALFAVPYLMSSIKVESIEVALIAALVLGLINTFIRPLLVLLTLPATLLTLGLFIFVINGLLFWFVGSFIDGFHVGGFCSTTRKSERGRAVHAADFRSDVQLRVFPPGNDRRGGEARRNPCATGAA